ncbi:tor Complex Tor2 interacting protein 1 [Schizosaccharomyces japonicus yFS275]|uniref:Tor Complex Tor2 interacting protein 1 n=1 Tax=Schizosaccharomyces japonicus (strain yFS275 / FY16936) TaxID=402676 RepID=B6JXM7_SCHJY|nr:tor Complex Tor2 interacting protein 1 [Schizosaccharomyces japonicus yFS275]EEB05171.1 tor Complex Tor2 interacting protein 1 [Schizosaccharomyces japonicus yFS275]
MSHVHEFGSGISCGCLNLLILNVPTILRNEWFTLKLSFLKIKFCSLFDVVPTANGSIVGCKVCGKPVFCTREKYTKEQILELKEQTPTQTISISLLKSAQNLDDLRKNEKSSHLGLAQNVVQAEENMNVLELGESISVQIETILRKTSPELRTHVQILMEEKRAENKAALLKFLQQQQSLYESFVRETLAEVLYLNQRSSSFLEHTDFENTNHDRIPLTSSPSPSGVNASAHSRSDENKQLVESRFTHKAKRRVAFNDKHEIIPNHSRSLSLVQQGVSISNLPGTRSYDLIRKNAFFKGTGVYTQPMNVGSDMSQQSISELSLSASGISNQGSQHSQQSSVIFEPIQTSHSYSEPVVIPNSLRIQESHEDLSDPIHSSSMDTSSEDEPAIALTGPSSVEDRKTRWFNLIQRTDREAQSSYAKSMGFQIHMDDEYEQKFLSQGWKSLN